MIGSLEHFIEIWKTEADSTEAVFGKLSDEALSRNDLWLAPLAWEIISFPVDMLAHTRLVLEAPDPEEFSPNSVDGILKAYDKAVDALIVQVHCHWMDDVLEAQDELYGRTWERKEILEALIFRQAHLRGQLCLLMRQAGLETPDLYGPMDQWIESMQSPEKSPQPEPIVDSAPVTPVESGEKEEINPFLADDDFQLDPEQEVPQ